MGSIRFRRGVDDRSASRGDDDGSLTWFDTEAGGESVGHDDSDDEGGDLPAALVDRAVLAATSTSTENVQSSPAATPSRRPCITGNDDAHFFEMMTSGELLRAARQRSTHTWARHPSRATVEDVMEDVD